MAVVLISDENRTITDKAAISEFLAPFGIYHETWPMEERVDPDAAPEAILKAYEPEIDVLKKQGGYVTADVISVSPATPNLDAMLAKFTMEHTHSEDEVRFILKGRGLFHIHPDQRPVFQRSRSRPAISSTCRRGPSTGSTCARTRRSARSASSRT